MKIELGDYVRTKKGFIGKVTDIDENCIYSQDTLDICEISNIQNDFCFKSEIAKHSKNIIDLVEKGDFVNGYKVVDFDLDYFNGNERRINPKRIEIKVDNGNYDFKNRIKIKDIKSILTHEQYEKMVYRLEE